MPQLQIKIKYKILRIIQIGVASSLLIFNDNMGGK
jgi:hypothetical protein